MDRLQSMRVFEQVVAEGGFAAAARKLDLAPAVVTRLVGDLERHLGVRLLQRTTRRLSLTPAGEAYLARLRVILSDIAEAEAQTQAHAHEMTGTVRIAALPGLATHLLAPAVAEFQRLHPQVVVDVHAEDMSDPDVEQYDFALVTDHVPVHASAIVRPVVRTQSVLCASPEYLRRHGEPTTVEALQHHRFARLRLPGMRLRPVTLIGEDGSRVEAAGRVVMVSNHLDTVLRATIDGVGLSSQSVQLVAPALKTGQLKRVLAPWITDRFTVLAVLPSRQFMPVRTRAFLEHLVEHAERAVAGVEAV